MPKLNHTGPEGQGPRTGRNLGGCTKNQEHPAKGKLGEGMGKRRKEGGGQGKGRRLQP